MMEYRYIDAERQIAYEKEKYMRKNTATSLFVTLILSAGVMVSCGNRKEPPNTESSVIETQYSESSIQEAETESNEREIRADEIKGTQEDKSTSENPIDTNTNVDKTSLSSEYKESDSTNSSGSSENDIRSTDNTNSNITSENNSGTDHSSDSINSNHSSSSIQSDNNSSDLISNRTNNTDLNSISELEYAITGGLAGLPSEGKDTDTNDSDGYYESMAEEAMRNVK